MGAPSGFVWREIDDWPVYNSAQFGRRMRLNGGSGYFDCVYNVPGTCPGGFQTQFDLLKWADPRASLVAWAACQCSFESITLPDTSRASITCVCMCVCVRVCPCMCVERGNTAGMCHSAYVLVCANATKNNARGTCPRFDVPPQDFFVSHNHWFWPHNCSDPTQCKNSDNQLINQANSTYVPVPDSPRPSAALKSLPNPQSL